MFGEESENEEVRAILSDARTRIYFMSLVHDSLYLQDDVHRAKINTYFQTLMQGYKEAFTGEEDTVLVQLSSSLDDDFDLPSAQLIQVAMIVNELLTNTSKYCLREHKQLHAEVRFHRSGENLVLYYLDEGPYYSEHYVEPGDEGTGRLLIQGLVNKIGGESGFIVESADANAFSEDLKNSELYLRLSGRPEGVRVFYVNVPV
jgi:two-component sensor histidine kinase